MDSSSSAIPIIAGVVGGVVALNIVLFVMWFIMRRRRSKAKRKLIEQRDASSLSLSRHSPAQMSQPMSPNYQELLIGVQDARRRSTLASDPPPRTRNILSKPPKPEERGTPPPTAAHEVNPEQAKQTLAALDTNLVREKLRPPPLLPISKPNLTAVPVNGTSIDTTTMPATNLKRAFSVRSADSASIYSVASAAPELHDRVFQPWSLAPIPASPLTPSRMESAQLLPARNERALIREELAPETFDKWRTEDNVSSSQIQGRRISGSIPPVPPLPLHLANPITPVSPLSPVTSLTHHRSNSGSYYRPHASPVPPSPVNAALPKPPPRSPLRDVRSQWIDS